MKLFRKILIFTLCTLLCVSTLSPTALAAGQTAQGIGFVSASSLRLRSAPNTSASVLATAPKNDCVVVLGESGEWYYVNYNLQTGYMYKEYLSVLAVENAELGYGTVSGSGVNLRSGPSTSGSVATVTTSGAKCYILGINNGWYKVIYNDITGYIRSDYIELTEYPYENQASPNTPQYFRGGKSIGTVPASDTSNPSTGDSSGASGAEILAEAQKYLGCPYVNGGSSPSGFDCSGFVYYVLKQCGYSPYRTPASQYTQGTSVEKSDLQAGDIVFFAGTAASGISHVGIYAGNGQFIHAPNSRSTVSYSSLTSGYWANHYYGARRMG